MIQKGSIESSLENLESDENVNLQSDFSVDAGTCANDELRDTFRDGMIIRRDVLAYLNDDGEEDKDVARAQTRSTAARRNSSVDDDLDLSHKLNDNVHGNVHINRGCKFVNKHERWQE